jgi:imidazolonepropionase-like amidohydrolase
VDAGIVAVRAARMLDVRAGTIVANAVLLIDGDRISAAGPLSEIDASHASRQIDLGDATLVPGLIDMHTHLTSDPTCKPYEGLALSTTRRALFGVQSARRTLDAGFTTVRDVGAAGFADVDLRDAIAAGEFPGPRMLVSGPPIGITGGHCDCNLLPPDLPVRGDGVADGPWAVRAKVRENQKYGADVIKICASGGVLSKGTEPGAEQLTLEEMSAIVDEAHRGGRKVAAHAHGARSIRDAILAGVDSIEHASLVDDDGIALAKDRGTYFVMDVYDTEYILGEAARMGTVLGESLRKEEALGRTQRENFGKAWRAGVKMAFGTDAGVYPHGDNAKQFSRMVRFGMQPLDAMRAATIWAADLLGRSSDCGALEPGRYADAIAVRGNPLDDVAVLEEVAFVMKAGRIVKHTLER